jgi:glycosyltransferase involved in cell wall biosynthesis
VAFVGRLTNWKGAETLLLAMLGAPRVTATIAGDGPAAPLLLALAEQLGVADRVAFLGRCTAERIAGLLDATDVLVLPSLYEGMSHTLLEAMARGVPCIVSDRGGNAELVRDGVNGVVIPPQRPAALREILVGLDRDRARLGYLGAGAARRALEFPFDSMATAYESILVDRAG